MGVEITVGALMHTPGDVDIEREGRGYHDLAGVVANVAFIASILC
jgi:hypothetical protein